MAVLTIVLVTDVTGEEPRDFPYIVGLDVRTDLLLQMRFCGYKANLTTDNTIRLSFSL
jgi:hypothetical protein